MSINMSKDIKAIKLGLQIPMPPLGIVGAGIGRRMHMLPDIYHHHHHNAIDQHIIGIHDTIHVHEPEGAFILNGIKYAPISNNTEENKGIPFRKTHTIIAAATMFHSPYMDNMYHIEDYSTSTKDKSGERKLPSGINIVKEYGLIQQKRSKLSKWQRDRVIEVFERNFYKV